MTLIYEAHVKLQVLIGGISFHWKQQQLRSVCVCVDWFVYVWDLSLIFQLIISFQVYQSHFFSRIPSKSNIQNQQGIHPFGASPMRFGKLL